MWQANTDNFLETIQKTTFSSNFVYGKGFNIWDLARKEKKRKKEKERKSTQASLRDTPFCPLALQVHEPLAPRQAEHMCVPPSLTTAKSALQERRHLRC